MRISKIRKALSVFLKVSSLIALYFSIFCLSLLIDTFVFMRLWEWFVVPFDVRQVAFREALGLLILINFLTYHFYGFKKEDNGMSLLIDSLTFLFARPIIIFSLAAAVRFLL